MQKRRGRQHKKEFIHFIYLARGSLYELITQIELARETTLLNAAVCKELLGSCEILARDLNALITSLKGTLPGTKN
nr:four helix bundle protein [Kosmotoga pacifica]